MSYSKAYIRTPEQALVYLVDCTLATVSHMAMLKSRSKSEYQRQIAIAQSGIDWIKDFKIETDSSRIVDVLTMVDKVNSVAAWASQYEEGAKRLS